VIWRETAPGLPKRPEPSSVAEILLVRFAEKVYRALVLKGKLPSDAWADVTDLIDHRLVELVQADEKTLDKP
jgi:hypothetical protein